MRCKNGVVSLGDDISQSFTTIHVPVQDRLPQNIRSPQNLMENDSPLPIAIKPLFGLVAETRLGLVWDSLTHISLVSFLLDKGKQNMIAPDVTPPNASHLWLFCLLTGFSSKNEMKTKFYPTCPKK